MNKQYLWFQLKKSKKLFVFEIVICILLQPVFLKMNNVVISDNGDRYLGGSEFPFFIMLYLFITALVYGFLV